MAHEHRLLDSCIAQYGIDCPREQINRIGNCGLIALAVAGKIDGDYSSSFSEVGDLVGPHVQLATPTVNQDESLGALTIALVVNPDSIHRGIVRFGLRSYRLLRQRIGTNGRDLSV